MSAERVVCTRPDVDIESRNKMLEAARQSKQACMNCIVGELHANGVVPSKHHVEAKL